MCTGKERQAPPNQPIGGAKLALHIGIIGSGVAAINIPPPEGEPCTRLWWALPNSKIVLTVIYAKIVNVNIVL